MQNHWDAIYRDADTQKLGWYEAKPSMSLELIEHCCLDPEQPILDVGAGASVLIDHLLARGHRRLIATDISSKALATMKARLGKEKEAFVQWLIDDITESKKLTSIGEVAVWHDRAVLHFLTEETERQAYRELLFRLVPVNGFAIIATFALGGAEMCSGLQVRQYNSSMLSEFLGPQFTLLESHDYPYFQPSGNPRPFIYTRFQKTSELFQDG
jgi:hypothetical protein